MTTYSIVRFYSRPYQREVIASGLPIEVVRAHCSDPETSSTTCKGIEPCKRTAERGAWFDGYSQD